MLQLYGRNCTKAEGDALMEDSGGPYGFAVIMDILSKPDHLEHKAAQNWLRTTLWRPLNLDSINSSLKRFNPMPVPVHYNQ